MDDAPQKPELKISLAIAIFIGIILIITDLIDLLPFAGDITDIVVGAPLQFYLFLIGVSGVAVLVSNIIELIPFLQEIPTRTIAWIITVIIDRNPKLEKAAQVAAITEGGGIESVGEVAEADEVAAETAEATQEVSETGAQGVQTAQGSEGAGQTEAENGTEEGEKKSEEALKKEEELNESLGEEPSPAEKLRREVFDQAGQGNSNGYGKGGNHEDEDEEDQDIDKNENNESADADEEIPVVPPISAISNNIDEDDVPVPRPPKKVFDIARAKTEKTEKLQDRWRNERQSDDDNQRPMAA